MTCDCVIFDLDGVLVSAVEWHYQALMEALAVFGVTIPADEHALVYNGLPTRTKLAILTSRTGFPERLHGVTEVLKQRYTAQLIEQYCRPDPSKLELFRHLRSQGIGIGLFSNSIRSSVELMLTRAGLISYFDCIVTNEDVSEPKPHPEGYLRACRELGVSPESAIAVEDSVPGIESARRAGLAVIEVSSPAEVTLERLSERLYPHRSGCVANA